jgi:phosphoglycolate phosphatase
MIQLLIFDLDGTLIDSRLDIANSVNAALRAMDLEPLELNQVAAYVGHGAPLLMRRVLGDAAPEEQVQLGLSLFLKHYAEHPLDATRLYPGVRESLDRLRAAGKQLAVLTNKPDAVTLAIVAGLGLRDHFLAVHGGDSFARKKPDPEGVFSILRRAQVSPEQAMMVGDSSVDIRTARNAGIRACGVLYGFQPESLSDPAPDLLVDRMEQLADSILGTQGDLT